MPCVDLFSEVVRRKRSALVCGKYESTWRAFCRTRIVRFQFTHDCRSQGELSHFATDLS
jgi:hypothetical protein